MTAEKRSDEELRALCDAARPGPWGVQQFLPEDREYEHQANVMHGIGGPDYGFVASSVFIDDAAFIAAARTAIPSLLDRLATE